MKPTLIALLPFLLSAQEMTGPTLGWSATADGRARQLIQGVAGAARLGPASEWPQDLHGFVISPSGRRAAALRDSVPLLIDLGSGQRTALPEAAESDTLVWSPLGSALLTANHLNGRVRTYVQRGAAWEVQPELTWAAESYAVSDDGQSILATVGEELLLRSAVGTRILGPKSAAFSFLASSDIPVVADEQELRIGNHRQPAPAGSVLLASPAANRVLLADRAGGRLFWFDGQGAPVAETGCACTIERLEYLGAAGTMRLVSADTGPAWFTETSNTSQRLFFVPTQFEVEP